LGIAGSAALSAGVGVSVTSAVAKFGWVKIFMAVAALGAATAVPVGYYAWKNAHRPRKEVVVVPASENAIPVPPVVNEVQKDVPDVQPSPAVADESSIKALPAPKFESKNDTNSALSEELAALDAVRSTLAHGDPTGALARLDNYNRSFPKGRLQLEAEVLRIDALMKSGQEDLAKKRAQAFLTKHPNSVLASRVRGLL
jgi:hypothetical protein